MVSHDAIFFFFFIVLLIKQGVVCVLGRVVLLRSSLYSAHNRLDRRQDYS